MGNGQDMSSIFNIVSKATIICGLSYCVFGGLPALLSGQFLNALGAVTLGSGTAALGYLGLKAPAWAASGFAGPPPSLPNPIPK